MANTAKKAILNAKVDGVLTDLNIRTHVNNVYYDDTTTLDTKLAEMLAALAKKAEGTDITSAINSLRQEMLGDTPVDAYDTFTELAAYIESHKDVADSLTAAIGNKADKSTVTSIQTSVNALEAAKHTHSNKAVLDGITAALVSAWSGKSKIYCSKTEPSGMENNDLWIQIVD